MQQITDARGGELTGAELMEAFSAHYLDHVSPYELVAYTHSSEEDSDQIAARVRVGGEEQVIEGEGNGPLAALVDAFAKAFGISISIRDYHEHAMSASADAKAAAYVEADVGDEVLWGVGMHSSILTASLRAVVNAVNRAESARALAEARSRRSRAPERTRRSAQTRRYTRGLRGCSSVGRASACHAEGREFESLHPLRESPAGVGFSAFWGSLDAVARVIDPCASMRQGERHATGGPSLRLVLPSSVVISP